MTEKELYIQTNSPGELSHWVKPITETLYKHAAHIKVNILLLPCQYATGQEEHLAKTFPNVHKVYLPKQSLKIIFTEKKPTPPPLCILHLGGDPFYTKKLAKRWQCPAIAYSESQRKLSGYKKVFYKNTDGDLMADSILSFSGKNDELRKKYGLYKNNYTLIFTGSRPQHFKLAFPLFLEAIHQCKKKDPNFEAILPISPYIPKSLFSKLSPSQVPSYIHFIQDENSLNLINLSQFVISIPGTNNMEVIYLNTPLMILIPINNLKILIFDGTLGLITHIPFIGSLIKWILIHFILKKKPYLSLPNQKFQKKVVPEIIEVFTSERIAEYILSFKNDKSNQKKQKEYFKKIQKKPNVCKKIVQEILKYQ